jgi:hypothetical protein
MKLIGLLTLAVAAACQTSRAPESHPSPIASQPRMDSALAARLCTRPAAVTVFGADCMLRYQSPPRRLLAPRNSPK